MLIQQRQNIPALATWVGEELGELRNQGVSDELYQDLLRKANSTHSIARYAKTSTYLN